MKMRCIRTATAYFKEMDPDTAVTESFIKRLIRSGVIGHRKAGKKYLVDVDQIVDYLHGEPRESDPRTDRTHTKLGG